MKNLFLAAFTLFSIASVAQNISGLYSGTLQNDSAKVTQQYELALSEYRGKITGYAYATFIANDTFYYSIRRVKATRQDGKLVVEDEALLVHNFPVRPDKGVHRISYIPLNGLNESDTLTTFAGSWKTTQTKKFYSVPGTMAMKRNNDSSRSALVAHLQELSLITPEQVKTAMGEEKTSTAVAKKQAPVTVPATAAPAATVSPTHEDLKKMEPLAAKPSATPAPAAPLAYTERKRPAPQLFDVTSDSLVLYFYDNGVVDGDVISVYANGEAVVAHIKLLGAATKKTLHLRPDVDTVEVLLVAETLGGIPPNTGLLIVQDGDTRYNVHFSADMQTNAALLFQKRKK